MSGIRCILNFDVAAVSRRSAEDGVSDLPSGAPTSRCQILPEEEQELASACHRPHGSSLKDIACATGETIDQVLRVYPQIDARQESAR